VWGLPTGLHINSGAHNSTKAWWTGLNTDPQSSYFSNENSVVNGPCFDLRELKRPMISLDFFSDLDISDGAVLQYSVNGGQDWITVGSNLVGTKEPGINWYNASSIFSNPGSQVIGQYGWTGDADSYPGKQGKWNNARFNLDMIPVAKRDQVRLRIAFASNDGNPPAGPYNGFAFDNVFVGDKKRTVMVEHFTNAVNNTSDQFLDAMYNGQAAVRQPDFFKLQYHMGIPSPDQLNRENPTDPGARTILYNITQSPYSIMDGIRGDYFKTKFNGNLGLIDLMELDRRSLEDPAFIIDTVIFDQTSPANILRAQVDFIYRDSMTNLTSPVIVHVGLVETDVMGNKNVLRKFLLNSEGLTLTRPWTYQDVYSIPQDVINYTLDVPIADPTKLYLVVFIQDKASQRIHQAGIFKAPAKVGIAPVGIEDDPITAEVRNISVYPNPASKEINFYLENELTRQYNWEIIDQRGVTVMDGQLNQDLTTPQHVVIKDLANGMYFVRIRLSDKTLVYRKIAILNSH
jgi:hypothetical protein